MNALKQSLNALREISSEIYHKYIPVIDDATDISAFADPLMKNPEVYNEFCSVLVNKLVKQQTILKMFRNPLKALEGDAMPLGYSQETTYINPAKARGFNVNDFAGLLMKYEAEVFAQYDVINSDLQYCVTVSREQLKKAMTSWDNLAQFITGLSNSLYNGMYIDEFRNTKNIVTGAYANNRAVVETVSAVSDKATAVALAQKLRQLYLDFQLPSDKYNAWSKNDAKGRKVVTWTNPEDIVVVIPSSVRTLLDTLVESEAYNLDKTILQGNIIVVDDFDSYDDEGTKVVDGSPIQAIICDKAFFKIHMGDEFMEEFRNPNNRTVQFYLNVIKAYSMSLFANGVILASSEAEDIPYKSISYGDTHFVEVEEEDTEGLELTVDPVTANADITYESSDTDVFTVLADSEDDRKCVVTGVAEGVAILTATTGSGADAKTAQITINVVGAE